MSHTSNQTAVFVWHHTTSHTAARFSASHTNCTHINTYTVDKAHFHIQHINSQTVNTHPLHICWLTVLEKFYYYNMLDCSGQIAPYTRENLSLPPFLYSLQLTAENSNYNKSNSLTTENLTLGNYSDLFNSELKHERQREEKEMELRKTQVLEEYRSSSLFSIPFLWLISHKGQEKNIRKRVLGLHMIKDGGDDSSANIFVNITSFLI